MSGSTPAWIMALIAFGFGGCAAIDPIARNGGRPDRIVLHYDFSGDWAATSGDECSPRLDLSGDVFIGIASDPGGAGQYYVERFFMLGPGERAQALVATMEPDGALPLVIETETLTDGRRLPVAYRLELSVVDTNHIRLTGFRAIGSGGSSVDLLAEAATGSGIPVLVAAGPRGLCLKRI